MSVVKKKKHVSKKNKKAWRKHCDIKDVEDFLEDQRLEERLGKFDTKPDNELFMVDTIGAQKGGEPQDGKPLTAHDGKPLTAKQRKRAKLTETPKCFEVLIPNSKVQDPNAKRNTVNPVGVKTTALSKLTEKRKFEKGVFQKKIEMSRKNRKMALEKKRKVKQIRQNFNLDLWGQQLPEAKGIPETLVGDFIPPEAQLHNILPEKRTRPKPPLAKTVVTRKAVELPHPGVSYNPSYQEHQKLLQEVVQHEEKLIKKERHLHRVTTNMFQKVTAQEKENQWREEMSVGLVPSNPSQPDSESDGEYKSVNPPVKNKKKDHKTRRRQREMIEEKEQLKRKKIDKQKITDLYKLRQLQSSITRCSEQQASRNAERTRRRELVSGSAAPALNAVRPTPREPAFVDPKELSGDLRHVAVKTNLLRERYESLQHRGALAASKLMMKKRRKLKSYFKEGHKVTDKEIEKYMPKASN